jgi:hypothetical protein
MPDRREQRALRRARRLIDQIDEVQGVGLGEKQTGGLGTGRRAVVVFVDKKRPAGDVLRVIPQTVGDVETDVVDSGGPFEARGVDATARLDVNTRRLRPVPCGCSLGHTRITAGTLGLYVHDTWTGRIVAVTNNHVAACSNDARVGDEIIQPGPYDGGAAGRDAFGRLLAFVPIRYDGAGNALVRLLRALRLWPAARPNRVDLAVVDPASPGIVACEIIDVEHYPRGWCDAAPGNEVIKSGRTTGLRAGVCEYTGVTVRVDYGRHGSATFEDQDIYSNMSMGGDSGSVILADDGATVLSLLFAGSSRYTIGSPWRHVVAAHDLKLGGMGHESDAALVAG